MREQKVSRDYIHPLKLVLKLLLKSKSANNRDNFSPRINLEESSRRESRNRDFSAAILRKWVIHAKATIILERTVNEA